MPGAASVRGGSLLLTQDDGTRDRVLSLASRDRRDIVAEHSSHSDAPEAPMRPVGKQRMPSRGRPCTVQSRPNEPQQHAL